jgi:hypothetical protein
MDDICTSDTLPIGRDVVRQALIAKTSLLHLLDVCSDPLHFLLNLPDL